MSTTPRYWFEVDGTARNYWYPTQDESTAGTVSVRATTYSVLESAGFAFVMVDRIRGAVGAISADYATADGSGTAGVDYTTTSGTLNWASGDSSPRIIAVPVIRTSATADKTFTVTLSNYASIGQATSTVTIKRLGNGELDFVGTAYQVQDPGTGTTTLTLQVQRFNSLKGSVGCSFHTTDGTALAGTDYNSATGTLSWADGQGGTKNISVTILGRAGSQGSRNFTVTIDTATGGVAIGTGNVATATIVESSPAANPTAAGSIPNQLADEASLAYATQVVEDPWTTTWRKDLFEDPCTQTWRQDVLVSGILSNKLGSFIGFDSGTETPVVAPPSHKRTIIHRPVPKA
jgi:hypothetical protein